MIFFYLTKYLNKNVTELASTLALLHYAKQRSDMYPSRAADAGTEDRAGVHVLQILLGRLVGSYELADTQICSLCLGIPSQISTVNSAYVYVRDACTFVGSCRNKEDPKLVKREDSDDESEPLPFQGTPGSLEAQEYFLLQTAKNCNGLPLQFGAAPAYKYRDDTKPMESEDAFKSIVGPQHQFMADRGREAANVCLWEFTSLFKMEQTAHSADLLKKHNQLRKKKDVAMDDAEQEDIEPAPTASTRQRSKKLQDAAMDDADVDVEAAPKAASGKRRGNLRVGLTENNILHKDWALMLNSKYPIPVFCGRRPDKCPRFLPEDAQPDEEWTLAANLFAQRILVVFSPWLSIHHINDPQLCNDVQYDASDLNVPLALIDTTEAQQQRSDFERLLDFMQANEQTFIGRCKNKVIQNLSDNLSTGATADSSRSVLMKFRARCATKWGSRKKDACMVDKTIGIPRIYKSYERDNEKDNKEDEEMTEKINDFQVMVDGSDMAPTEYQRQEHLFCEQQTSNFDRIYNVDEHAASGHKLADMDIHTVTTDMVVSFDARFDTIFKKLKDKTLPKTSIPQKKLCKPWKTSAPLAPPKQMNDDQRRAIDAITPTIENYSYFNIDPSRFKAVTPGYWMITGGPGTGITGFVKYTSIWCIYTHDCVCDCRQDICLQTIDFNS